LNEKIYTIPVTMAFEKNDGCPFCTLMHELEVTELDLILGASMMEPDVRIETNKQGFCGEHYDKMFELKNRLGLGLMLESHLDAIKKGVSIKNGLFVKDPGAVTSDYLGKLNNDCYVCSRINEKFSKMIETAAILWEREKQFREMTKTQPYFCFPHYELFLQVAPKYISKKNYPDFLNDINELQTKVLNELQCDVSWFCKKFDYRYDKEPWGNAKDSIERTIKFLCGEKDKKQRL